MNVLEALIQICKMANATLNSKSVVLTENDIPRAAKKDANLQNLKEEASPASNWWFWAHYEYVQCIIHWVPTLTGVIALAFAQSIIQ